MCEQLRYVKEAVTVLVLLGCVAGGTLQAQKFAKYSPVSLDVVIESSDSFGGACGICSDEGGAYLDGIDGVTAEFDQYGNLIIDFLAGRSQTPFRKIQYDFRQPYADGAVDRGVVAPDDNYMSTVHAPQTPMQLMGPGSTQCAGGIVTYTLDDAKRTQFRVYFQRPLAPFDMSMTSGLLVTRVDENTWTVETKNAGCADPSPGVGRLIETPTKGAFDYSNRGLYQMPLNMTLTRRQ